MNQIQRAKEIYLKWKNEKRPCPDGVAITGCTTKETMVILRYGGDVMFVIFNNVTDEKKFMFVAQMKWNDKRMWESILDIIDKLKSKLIQR